MRSRDEYAGDDNKPQREARRPSRHARRVAGYFLRGKNKRKSFGADTKSDAELLNEIERQADKSRDIHVSKSIPRSIEAHHVHMLKCRGHRMMCGFSGQKNARDVRASRDFVMAERNCPCRSSITGPAYCPRIRRAERQVRRTPTAGPILRQ